MSIHWADVIAEKLEKSGPHTIATGITPSGPVHIGNMREVMTAEAVYRALLDRGVEARLIYIADTYDRLRRLYPFLPESFTGAHRQAALGDTLPHGMLRELRRPLLESLPEEHGAAGH